MHVPSQEYSLVHLKKGVRRSLGKRAVNKGLGEFKRGSFHSLERVSQKWGALHWIRKMLFF